MLKKVMERLKPVLLVGFIVGGFVVLLGGQPAHFDQERSVLVHATPAQISPFLLDFKRWEEWSTWSPKDVPGFQQTFEGEASGLGARWRWEGTNGRGAQLEIVRIDERKVVIDVRRTNPVSGIDFELAPEAENTRVTWHSVGMSPLLIAWLNQSDLASYEADVEQSLTKLKTVVEAAR